MTLGYFELAFMSTSNVNFFYVKGESMKFEKWVANQGGPVSLALKLRVQPARVRTWLRGEASPQVLIMQKMVNLAKGELTYDDIINGTKTGGAK